jgi:hypothetical protein
VGGHPRDSFQAVHQIQVGENRIAVLRLSFAVGGNVRGPDENLIPAWIGRAEVLLQLPASRLSSTWNTVARTALPLTWPYSKHIETDYSYMSIMRREKVGFWKVSRSRVDEILPE